jgi:hypothetical protein
MKKSPGATFHLCARGCPFERLLPWGRLAVRLQRSKELRAPGRDPFGPAKSAKSAKSVGQATFGHPPAYFLAGPSVMNLRPPNR